MVTVVFEVEYAVETEEEARVRAERDAGPIFAQPDVLAVSAGMKREYVPSELPITERYLEDPGE